jgi:hypothetical protein
MEVMYPWCNFQKRRAFSFFQIDKYNILDFKVTAPLASAFKCVNVLLPITVGDKRKGTEKAV